MKKILICLLIAFPILAGAQSDLEKLANSPRHQEWVEITYNGRTVHTFVVYPEVTEKTKVVMVIHENRGLNDWARVFADELAEKGFIAIAPDLLSQTNDSIKKTSDFKNPDAAREALYALSMEQITADLDATFAYAKTIAAGNGKISVVGFCWGGSQCFNYATINPNLEEAIVFYGTAPEEKEVFKKIETPVYGFYGGNDARVNATIEQTELLMNSSGKTYDYKIYEGGGHGYMRSGSQPNAEEVNSNARKNSWERLLSILKN
ncbi:MAG: carboxymethylenebutenolidase [Flavobacteriaceae bacterium CG18_big_fil_WC_8_21_14_2_50_34_36]|nr:MAG: carboxymethylenebutenolidase [Flavobacteriaceae bacterium CG18_big_fil_WC_8_21_14_2_50_34_36]